MTRLINRKTWVCASLCSMLLAAYALPATAGSGDPKFKTTEIEKSQAWGTANADYNNDGHMDIFITGHDDNDRIWYWTKNGFAPSAQRLKDTEPGWIDRHDCDAADVNLDGMMDFYCSIGSNKGTDVGPNQLWIQGPLGKHTKVFNHGAEDEYGRGRWVQFFNFNGDAYPDLFVTNTPLGRDDDYENMNQVFVNNGDQTFTKVKTVAWGEFGSQCLDKGDINKDGWDDIIICNEWNDKLAHIYLNDRRGNFTVIPNPGSGLFNKALLEDMNGDGRDDLVALTHDDKLEIYLNTGKAPAFFGAAAFVSQLDQPTYGLTVGDFNRDGNMDVYVVQRQQGCVNAGTHNDTAPDVIFAGKGKQGWTKRVIADQKLAGCGSGAATIEKSKVLLLNGDEGNVGPNVLMEPIRK